MTDRELLEMAARAAGMTYVHGESWDDDAGWNPLEDDGDALRLAVEMRLTVCTDGHSTVSASEAWRRDGAFVTQRVSECSNKLAATRRAIVRAAAAIGSKHE